MPGEAASEVREGGGRRDSWCESWDFFLEHGMDTGICDVSIMVKV